MTLQWLYVLKPTRLEMLTEGTTPREREVLNLHSQHLEKLADERVMLVSGRTLVNSDETMGLAVFVAEDEGQARAIMESDPAIVHGVMTATLYPYRVAFGSPDGLSAVLSG